MMHTVPEIIWISAKTKYLAHHGCVDATVYVWYLDQIYVCKQVPDIYYGIRSSRDRLGFDAEFYKIIFGSQFNRSIKCNKGMFLIQ